MLALARDPERRQRLAEAGQAFYETHFAWNHCASGLLETLARYSPAASASVPTSQKHHSENS